MHKVSQFTGHKASIFALAPFDRPGTFLSGGGDGWIVSWELDNPDLGKLVARISGRIYSLAYLPDSASVVAGNMDGGIHWVPLADPDKTKNIAAHQKGVFGLLPLGKNLFSAGGDGSIQKWSIQEKRSLESLIISNRSIRSLIAAPDGKTLIAGASDGNIYFIDSEQMIVTRHISAAHDSSVFSLALYPDGKTLISGGRDARIKWWDLKEKPICTQNLPAHLFTVNDLAFHPEGKIFASASRDKSIKIWDAEGRKLIKVLEGYRDEGHFNSVNALLWCDSGKALCSTGDDRSIIHWTF